jgi:hypothetical protein
MSFTLTRTAAAAIATVATCNCALANIALSCSGTMDEGSTQQASMLSVILDPIQGTIAFGDAAPIPAQRDAADRTFTFGNATSSTFGIFNMATGSIFISSYGPVATYRGVCKKLDNASRDAGQSRTEPR